MKGIRTGLNKHGFDHTIRQNKRLETGSCFLRNIETKNKPWNSICFDCPDA
jgi:hypothetical protein